MTSTDERIANLSPAKRLLLEQYLQGKLAQRATSTPEPNILHHELEAAPLSFSQQRLWLLQQIQPENRTFHESGAWQMTGVLNVAALKHSLAEIIRRHAILRTRIVVQNGEPIQQIDPAGLFELPSIDLRQQLDTVAERLAYTQQLRRQLSQKAYDFSQEYPYRFRLVQVADEEHVLIIARHHIASDGWSIGIFQRELSLLYRAFAQGLSSPLPELPVQYADFAVWQRSTLQSERVEKQVAYWQKQLQEPPVLQLPTDFPCRSEQDDDGDTEEFTLPPALTQSLKSLSKTQGATLYMVLLAAFKVLLFRYTGQQDLSVGAPIAGRNRAELEDLLGCFLNTLVLRSQLNADDSFLSLLAQVHQTTLAAYANQDVPVEKLIEILRPERNGANSPLFQVLFLLQNMPRHALELPGLAVSPLSRLNESVTYDLSCTLSERDGTINGRLTYRRDLFRAETIARLAGHYRVLLENIVADPTQTIAQLPLLTELERHTLLVKWNQTQVQPPIEQNILELLTTQVTQRPNAVAFLMKDAKLSYCELEERSTQLASVLCMAGCKRGTVVGVCLARSFEVVIALFAIFKAGGVYLPLDPTYPRQRLSFMLDDSQTAMVITNRSLQTTLPSSAKLVYVDTLDSCSSTPPASQALCLPTDSAYIIYTSGSTGPPKGVIVPHRQILNRLWWMWRTYPFQEGEMSCQKTTLNFVDSLWELLGPMLQGSPTVILSDEVVRDPQQLIQNLARYGITRLWVVPTLLRAMMQALPNEGAFLPKLGVLVASGEPLPHELFVQAQTKLPQATLYNLYGTSEVWDATWYEPVQSPDAQQRSHHGTTLPIGKPIDNVQAYILDTYLQPVPIGVAGELYIGGDGVAIGYLNQPAMNEEKFIANPLGIGHLYKTGDQARYLPDGNIEFLGRLDNQVKIRGFRVELGEVEAVLLQHPAVQQAVMIVDTEVSGTKRLIAYVVAKPDQTLTAPTLRQSMTDSVPAYMIPALFVFLEKLPLTASGKIDRKALPAAQITNIGVQNEAVAARDPLESQLVQIWEKVLNVRPIHIHDNFFDLGGHSLLAVQLFDRIHKVTSKALPLSVLFQSPTIEQLAAIVRQRDWSPTWQSLVPVQTRGNKPPLFLAPPGGSTVLNFANITRHLPSDQPVYGLEYLGMDRKHSQQKPHDRVEEMAAYYLQQITKLQTEGPYLLAGICFGAHLMLEVAQQLVAEGAEVALFAVLDAGPPAHGPTWHYPKRFSREHFQILQDYWREESFLKWVKGHITNQRNRFLKRFNLEKRHFLSVSVAHYRAQLSYHAKPYKGRLCLLQSEEYARLKDKQGRWQLLAQEGFIKDVIPNTTHRTLLLQEPYTKVLAEKLTAQIETVLTQHSR